MLKLSRIVLALSMLLFAARANAQVVGASAVTLTSRSTVPSALVTGVWNHSGTLQLQCSGCSTILRAPGIIESTVGGFKFPNGSVQTVAAVQTNVLFYDELNIFEACRNTSTGAASVPTTGSAGEKDGLALYFTKNATVTGITFFWNSASPSRTIEYNLNLGWSGTQTNLAHNTTTTGTGGEITVSFTTPIAVTAYTPIIGWIMEPTGNANVQSCDNNPSPSAYANNGSLSYPFLIGNNAMEISQVFGTGGISPGNTTPPGAQLGSTRHFPIRINYTIP